MRQDYFFIACSLVFLILIAGCISPVPSSNSATAADGIRSTRLLNATNGSYSVNASIPVIPEDIMIYSVERPGYSKEWVSSLAKQLGMNGEIREEEDSFSAGEQDENAHLAVGKDIRHINFWEKQGEYSSGNLTEAEAILSVKKFLAESDLLSDAMEPEIAYNTAISVSGPPGPITRTSQEMVLVFSRRINGLRSWQSTAMITVDSQGNITSMFIVWPDYRPVKTVPSKSPERAFEEFQAKKLEFSESGIYINPERVVVDTVFLGYATIEEKTLKPVYYFYGYGIQGNVTSRFDTVPISAIEGEF